MHSHKLFTALPIIIEGHETAFNGFEYQFTTEKPLKDLKLTHNYYGNCSTTPSNPWSETRSSPSVDSLEQT